MQVSAVDNQRRHCLNGTAWGGGGQLYKRFTMIHYLAFSHRANPMDKVKVEQGCSGFPQVSR